VKDVACGIFGRLRKMRKKLHEVKAQSLEANLEIIKFSNPPIARAHRSEIFF